MSDTTCFGLSRKSSPYSIPRYVPLLNVFVPSCPVIGFGRPCLVVVVHGAIIESGCVLGVDGGGSCRSQRNLFGRFCRKTYVLTIHICGCIRIVTVFVEHQTHSSLIRLVGKLLSCRHSSCTCLILCRRAGRRHSTCALSTKNFSSFNRRRRSSNDSVVGPCSMRRRCRGSNVSADAHAPARTSCPQCAIEHGLTLVLHERDLLQASENLFLVSNTDTGRNLYVIAKTSAEQQVFVAFFSVPAHALNVHGDNLRPSAGHAGNHHKLGAQEAPSAIISLGTGMGLEGHLKGLLQVDLWSAVVLLPQASVKMAMLWPASMPGSRITTGLARSSCLPRRQCCRAGTPTSSTMGKFDHTKTRELRNATKKGKDLSRYDKARNRDCTF